MPKRLKKILVLLMAVIIGIWWYLTIALSASALANLYLYLHYDSYRNVESTISKVNFPVGHRSCLHYIVAAGNIKNIWVLPETKPVKKTGDKILILLREDGNGEHVDRRNMRAIEYYGGIKEHSLRYFLAWFLLLLPLSIAAIPVFIRLNAWWRKDTKPRHG